LARRGDRALAVRLVGLDQSGLFEQYWDMIRATDLESFEAAQRRLQMPMFNTVYADRDGHILYLSGGRVPVRPEGGWAEWQGVMPGTESRTLWTETHPYDDLPRVVDPPAGWVQNANDPAWTSTFPPALDADAFPPYLSPRAMGFRPQRSARMLAEDSSITFDELRAYKHDTRLELADRLLDDLLPAARTHGTPLAKQAAEVLGAWDRRADATSRGAVLFAAWAQRLGPGSFAEPWREDAPRTTPDGLADPAAAATALDAAAREVTDAYGALDVPWGEVYRLRFGGADLPANGGPGELGLFRVLWFAPDDDRRFRAVGGDSYVALVEFSDPVRAEVLTTYGNASQPGSAHRGDQVELFARQELRPVWRTRAEVEANLEGRTAFGPDDGAAYARN
ncbi:MAG: penicillin acylase family protein, partial [Rhodothermales bacterium]|nr:penicillin acylase family protein [Rhodothermales bacterium]